MGGQAGLSVSGLHHAYGKKPALNGVGFDIPTGQFCALLGPNGAGKSTLFALLTGLFVSDRGNIKISSIDLKSKPGKALSKIGVVFQQPTLDPDLTVQQNMAYSAALHGLAGQDAKKGIQSALQKLNMQERANEKVRALNGGHRRRMEIARALVHKPDVLLLDEPTVGLDAASRTAITDHVHDLAQTMDLTVLWATHLVDEVRPDDQLVILHEGNVVANDTCSAVSGDASLAQTFADLTEQAEA